MTAISITTPDSPTPIGAEERETLLEELAEAAATNDATRELMDNLVHAGRTFTPTDQQILILLRATDHIRRDPSRSTSSLGMLHSRLANAVHVERVAYSLVLAGGEEAPTPFTSYSGEYDDGDRLITQSGEAYRVLSHGEPTRGVTTLIVERWLQV